MKYLLSMIALACMMASCGDNIENSSSEQNLSKKPLPYYGIHDINPSNSEDTLYYTVPKFSFINQNGREVSHKDYIGKVYVTDFFFTTCPTICPIMSSQMSRLQEIIKQKNLSDDIMLLSHTINPENDQPEVLMEYANSMGADTTNWNFVTGARPDIYDQAKNGYFINALESDTAAGGFIHSDNFILVDKQMHIRGYYDGTSTQEVDSLIRDIEQLIREK